MVETRRTGDREELPIRTEAGGRIGAVASRAKADAGGGVRQRIPSLRALAALLVNGVLRLPAGYRRGMFLDMLV